MKYYLSAVLFFVTLCVFSQDRIKTVSGEVVQAKVLEVTKNEVKYKRYSNPDGPVYVIGTQEIREITYQNGEKEVFNSVNSPASNLENNRASVDPSIVELFNSMTRRNNRVYIVSDNDNAVVHAAKAINRWGYWVVTERKYNADFILSFNINFSGAEAYGTADFINPRNGKIIRSTNEFRVSPTWDLNVKRGLVNVIVDDGIRPMFR
ncbi:MAG: hypothetical protein GYA41_04510 [Bacteroidales bacterium]|nr:hypothetical protein [Bacteroidales bacterium]